MKIMYLLQTETGKNCALVHLNVAEQVVMFSNDYDGVHYERVILFKPKCWLLSNYAFISF